MRGLDGDAPVGAQNAPTGRLRENRTEAERGFAHRLSPLADKTEHLKAEHLLPGGAAVMESFFSTVKSELGEHFESHRDAKMKLFDYIEVFYNQRRRHSTLGQISPAAFERRAAEEGMDAMETAQTAVSHSAHTRRFSLGGKTEEQRRPRS